jgi:hypothetical protein
MPDPQCTEETHYFPTPDKAWSLCLCGERKVPPPLRYGGVNHDPHETAPKDPYRGWRRKQRPRK